MTAPPWDRAQLFWVTKRIAVGPHPGGDAAGLLAAGVTHVLNVGESPSTRYETAGAGKLAVRWVPFPDGERIPDHLVRASVSALHEMLEPEASRVLVHCVAGHNRSPTVIWLYLIATGMAPTHAESLIADASFDAVPGHPRLADAASVELARAIGRGWSRR